MKSIKILLLILLIFSSCKTYYVLPSELAAQISKTHVKSSANLSLYPRSKGWGLAKEEVFGTDIGKLYCYDKTGKHDSIKFRYCRFKLKSGKTLGQFPGAIISQLLIKDNFFSRFTIQSEEKIETSKNVVSA